MEAVHGVVGLLLVKDKHFFSNNKQISDPEVTRLTKINFTFMMLVFPL
jgi:hypothetical protein